MAVVPRAQASIADGAWQAPVLNVCLWIASGLGTIWLSAVALTFPAAGKTPEFFFAIGCFAAVWIGAIVRRLGQRVRVLLLLFCCLGVASVALEIAGPRPAPVVMMVVFVLLTTLYFGRNAGIISGGVVVVVYVTTALGWITGTFPLSQALVMQDLSDSRPWILATLIQLLGVGAVGSIVAYVLDHATRALRRACESEEKFAKAFRASPDAMIITDLVTGEIVDVNEGLEQMFGLSRAEVIGRSTISLGMWSEPRERETLKAAIAQSGVVRGLRGSGRRSDGTTFMFEASAEVIELHGRRCLVGVAHDISERLRHEQEREQLALRMRENQRLEALGTLAGGVAHDFNNLLMVMLSHAELIQTESADAARVRKDSEQILLAGARAKDLVRQILAFSRAPVSERRRLQCGDVIQEALRLLRSTLPATIDIKADLDPSCPAILADESQLHQVIMNLGSNAGHAMRDRSGVLSVRLEGAMIDALQTVSWPELKAGPHVRLTVADTGSGMTETIRARIFDPFFTTKAPGEGTGLGLAVVHGIVRNHGGAILVESEAGRGTTFTMYFPALADAPARAPELVVAEVTGRGETIMLIDDEPSICRAVSLTLVRQGYVVESFSDAREAVARLREAPHRFALILTDLTMPHLTGIDVADVVQSLRPELPVLAMTGYNAFSTNQSARAAGIRELLLKPVARADLAAALRRALDPPSGR